MFLKSLPLTAGGKLDRNALPVPDQTRSELKVDFTAPRTAVEERLASIWSKVLKIDKVGVNDNFFHLGGHSLLATQVISRINDSFAINIRLRRLFETPTIAGLAASIDDNLGIDKYPQRIPPIVPITRNHDAPLSFAQQRLWFLDRLEPDSAAYNVPAAFRLVGELDGHALEQSLNEIVRRHEVLRTVVATVNGDPVQKLLPPSPLALTCTDISDRPETDREQALPRLLSEEAAKPFDLSRGPLLRTKLLRLAPQDHVLFLNMHHVVSDGWSMGVLFREISDLYDAYCSGKTSPLPELPVQYADYTVWQREWLQGENLENQLSYWRKQLEGLMTLQLPTDCAHPAVRTYRGSSQALNFSARLSQAIKSLSQREGGTLFMTLLAAFQILLSRYSGQSDIVVGSPIAGRNRQETETLIGFFVNTLVLRADLSNHPTFRELLRQVRETTLEAHSHQDLPFEKLVEDLQPQRNLNQNPLFQVTFQLDDNSSQLLTLPAIDVEEMELDSGISRFDLSLSMIDNGKSFKGTLQYNTDIFNADTIDRMLGHYQRLLEGIVDNPEQRIDELALLTDAEKHQLLVEWNETKRDYPSEKCIHQLFEEQVERTPEAVAVVFEGQQLTYRELNDRANQLAHHLRNLGAKPNTLVALSLGRSIELVVAIYGVLKAGGAYLPVDPGYPQERLESMLQGVQASIMIMKGEAELSRSALVHVVDLVSSRFEIEKQSKANPSQLSQPSDLIYVIFTSGSTGRPKGAAVYHQSFTNLVEWYTTSFDITEKDKALVISSPSFDLTQKNIFGPLIRGGELHLVAGPEYDPGAINRIIAEQKITLINCTPSAFYPLVEQAELRGYEDLTSLREVFLGGESILLARSRHWLESEACHSEIVNTYGPTECTDVCAYYRLDRRSLDAYNFVPLGRPIDNVALVALDEHWQLCPIGVIGELCIAGEGVGAGYVNDAELTGQKFVANPFKELSGETLYKTGDLVRYLRDGNFEYLGRRDHQVKIRGHRIELGEIEALLGQHPAVQQAVVLAREDHPGDRRLVAYAAAAPGFSASASELRSYLQHKLPEYMVPSMFMFLESLPLTPNGKLDQKALPAPDPTRPELKEGFTAPRTATEEVLAGIWAEVLKLDKVGIRDSFFDLGGHSLLAVRLTNTIQKQFKTAIRVAHVFAAPTVEQFALLLQAPRESNWSSLVALNSQGTRRPFFWVHGEASDAYLPRYLGPDQPLYGLRHQSEDGRPALYRTVQEIAAHYLEEIRSVQPEGPYLLGGYCFGALVALEMAQRLQAHRQAIDLLVFMDPPSGQTLNWQDRSQQAATRSLLDDLRRHLHGIAMLRTQAKWSYVLERAIAKVRETMLNAFNPVKKITQKVIWETHVVLGLPIPLSMRSPYILEIYRKAMRGYAPRPYLGNLVIFCQDEYPEQSRLKWSDPNRALTQVYKMPGDHTSVLQEPNVGYWAKTLKSCLDVVQLRSTKS
ncbi:MAG: amino acid adenylation domain-containing protein [Candidatus Binatia bacterium]